MLLRVSLDSIRNSCNVCIVALIPNIAVKKGKHKMYILALELTWEARNSARQILREFDYPIFSAFFAMVLRLCKLFPLIKKN